MNNRSLARGTLTAGIASSIKLGVQVIALPLMARLVGPTDYGLFGLAMPAVAFVMILADSGFGISLAREPESNVDIWSTATWFLLGLGIVLAGTVVLWSLIQAHIVRQPLLPWIMGALALCPILLAITVPASARLVRQGRIGVGSILDLVGNLAGVATAIGLALAGAGVWSLVAQQIVFWSLKALLSNVMAPFLPRPRFTPKYLHDHLKIGGLILSGKLLDAGGRTVEASLISRNLGAEFLGAYTFANQLPRFLSEAVGNSLWSMLYSYALRTENLDSMVRVYRLALRIFALLVFPGVVIISVLAQPLVDGILGPRWESAITILRVLLITQAFNALGGIGNAVLYARGQAKIPFRISVEGVLLRVGAVSAAPWIGFNWMSVTLGAIDLDLGSRSIYAASRERECRPLATLASISMPAVASGLSGLVCWGLASNRVALLGLAGFAETVVHATAGAGVYLLLLFVFDRRRTLGDVITVYKLIRG
jgi:O-antigen/teichoic acid export membrane protein